MWIHPSTTVFGGQGTSLLSDQRVYIPTQHLSESFGVFWSSSRPCDLGSGSAGREMYSEMTPLEMFWRSESNRTMLLQCQSLTLLPLRSGRNTSKSRITNVSHSTYGAELLSCSVHSWYPDLAQKENVSKRRRIRKVYGTRSSQAVPHPSTILARRCLTSVIRRERVYSSWYGRRQYYLNISSSHCFLLSIRQAYITSSAYIWKTNSGVWSRYM